MIKNILVIYIVLSWLNVFSQIRGFFDSSKQINLENNFKKIPLSKEAEKHLFILTESPHPAGTETDYKTALYVKNKFSEYGINSEIVEYKVYLPYPKNVSVKLLEPETYLAPTKEEGWNWDKDSYDSDIILPFNAYSPSGNVTADVVYVNYGMTEDYEKLKDLGVDVSGKIVIARYGKNFRGVKAKVAEENGASGLIIYSDPIDDGYFKGDVYPRGPWRNESAVQRGSIQYIFYYPGDPLTPGFPSTKNAKYLDPAKSKTNLPKIPTTPISYKDATPILKNLGGKNVPNGWQGALPFAYHTGPGASKVNLKLEMDYAIRPIWNVIGKIDGTLEKDKFIVIGNHRDAWGFGAVDPNSGTSVMLETARGFGELLKTGWKPKRTIIFASWDGEEYGLIGSTEWVEENKENLSKNCIAYLNVDSGVSGENFGSSATPSLNELIKEVTQTIEDPLKGKTIYDIVTQKDKSKIPKPLRIGRLGSGSDYTAFLDYVGIPSLDMSFNGPYGVYHAIHDDFYWMKNFGDPTFMYHATLAKILGVTALRITESDIYPLDFKSYSDSLAIYLAEVGNGKADEDSIIIDLTELAGEIKKLQTNSDSLNKKIEKFASKLTKEKLKLFNEKIIMFERNFIESKGLPEREWFKHLIYAPGFYLGYGAKIFPGITESIDKKNWNTAKEQVKILTEAFKRANNSIIDILKIF
jgi:N-acetylated-alpha-linked acidic dipeptidase